MSIIKLFVICFLFYTSLEVSVTKIDVNNFEELVRNTNDIWLLEFYSERCGTCQEFEPTWKKVVPKINGVKIGRINIDKKEGLKLAQNVGVLDNGIPNIQLMKGKTQDITIMRGIDDLFDEQKLLSTINLNLKKMQSLGNGDL